LLRIQRSTAGYAESLLLTPEGQHKASRLTSSC
jgi:hypothetical protein